MLFLENFERSSDMRLKIALEFNTKEMPFPFIIPITGNTSVLCRAAMMDDICGDWCSAWLVIFEEETCGGGVEIWSSLIFCFRSHAFFFCRVRVCFVKHTPISLCYTSRIGSRVLRSSLVSTLCGIVLPFLIPLLEDRSVGIRETLFPGMTWFLALLTEWFQGGLVLSCWDVILFNRV